MTPRLQYHPGSIYLAAGLDSDGVHARSSETSPGPFRCVAHPTNLVSPRTYIFAMLDRDQEGKTQPCNGPLIVSDNERFAIMALHV